LYWCHVDLQVHHGCLHAGLAGCAVRKTCKWYKAGHSTLPAVPYSQGLPIDISAFRQMSLHQCVYVQLVSTCHACTVGHECTMHEQCMHNVCAAHASTKADAMHRACCKLSSTSGLDPAPCKRSHGKVVWDQGRQSPARLTFIGRQGVV